MPPGVVLATLAVFEIVRACVPQEVSVVENGAVVKCAGGLAGGTALDVARWR